MTRKNTSLKNFVKDYLGVGTRDNPRQNHEAMIDVQIKKAQDNPGQRTLLDIVAESGSAGPIKARRERENEDLEIEIVPVKLVVYVIFATSTDVQHGSGEQVMVQGTGQIVV